MLSRVGARTLATTPLLKGPIRKRILSAVVAVVALSFAAVASADPAHEGAKGHKEHDGKAFPMKAETFQAREAAHEAKWKARFETKIQKLPADKAKIVRERMQVRLGNVHAKVAEVTKDGTVTKEEAAEVRKASHGGKHNKKR